MNGQDRDTLGGVKEGLTLTAGTEESLALLLHVGIQKEMEVGLSARSKQRRAAMLEHETTWTHSEWLDWPMLPPRPGPVLESSTGM